MSCVSQAYEFGCSDRASPSLPALYALAFFDLDTAVKEARRQQSRAKIDHDLALNVEGEEKRKNDKGNMEGKQ